MSNAYVILTKQGSTFPGYNMGKVLQQNPKLRSNIYVITFNPLNA